MVDKIDFVLVSLCTCKRPKMLLCALEAINKLKVPDDIRVEILVVDNDDQESGKVSIEKFKQESKFVVNYFLEPIRGISNARNRLLKEAVNLGATHVAMFDDDESLDENWLLKHIELYNKYEIPIISSGPTHNKFIGDFPAYIRKNFVFKVSTTKKTGEKRHFCAGGNVFFPLSIVRDKGIYFDNKFVFMGGEDGDFFNRAYNAGYEIVWNNEAVAYELIGKERANLKWILNRNYYNGFSGSSVRFKNCDKKCLKLFYFIKMVFILLIDILFLIPSMLLGRVMFFNILGLIFKNTGKVMGLLRVKPINYYENICGE